MTDTNDLTQDERLQQKKRAHLQFKNTAHFTSVEEMQAHITACGSNYQLAGNGARPVSGVIAGNCLVLETRWPISNTPVFYSRFVGASGHVEVIRLSGEHSRSAESAIAWLSSEYFALNKLDILAENDLPRHELDEPELLDIVENDRTCATYQKHLKFYEAYNHWLAGQTGVVLLRM